MNRITRPLAIPLVVVLATACTSAPPSSVAVPPSTTSVATADATRAPAQGDVAGAIEAYRRVLAREPRAQDARYNLALVLRLARRDAEATPEFLAAAEAGLPRAQYFAGAAYASGAGVEFDLVAAITWWTRGAEQGVTQADEALAQIGRASCREGG